MERIDRLKGLPIIGQKYLVPCIIEQRSPLTKWIEDFGRMTPIEIMQYEVYPIINHLHTDRENGQNYPHYHIDFRFTEFKSITSFQVRETKSKYHFTNYTRYHIIGDLPKIEYHPLKLLRLDQMAITDVRMIGKSKLKHKCIHKGKCPHRGYDLSQEPIIDSKITCPLHGLQFDAITKQLINEYEILK